VLERGSVEGQLFHSAAVQALATPPGSVERQLVGLVRADLVRPDRPQLPVGDAYRFRHLLIRDAAYDALPKATRAELHERFAAWLEERGPELVEHDEILGYHYEQAYRYRDELGPADAKAEALAARASALLVAGGRAARSRGDLAAAVSLLSRAAEIDRSSRLQLIPEIGEVMFETGQLAEAAALLDEAIELAHAGGDEAVEAVAAVWRAMIAGHRGEDATAEETVRKAERAAAVLERMGDRPRLATVLDICGRHEYYLGHAQQGVEVLRRALAVALEAGDLHRAVQSFVWSIGAMNYGPTPISEIYASLEAVPDPIRSSVDIDLAILMADAQLLAYVGRCNEARTALATARARMLELGRATHHMGAMMQLGLIELIAGDAEAAVRAYREGYDGLGELGETGFRSTMATMLAAALVQVGRPEEAEAILLEAEELAAADDADPQVRRRWVRGQILAGRGRLKEAEGLARQAVTLASTTDYLPLQGDALVALGDVLIAGGKDEQALVALREAVELFDRKEATAPAAQARARIEELRAGLGAELS